MPIGTPCLSKEDDYRRVLDWISVRRSLKTSNASLKLDGTNHSVLAGTVSTASMNVSTKDDFVRPSSRRFLVFSESRVELRT